VTKIDLSLPDRVSDEPKPVDELIGKLIVPFG
jgi:hypothetical protein